MSKAKNIDSRFYVNLPRNQMLREKVARAIYYGDGWTMWPLDITDYDTWRDDQGEVCNGTEKWFKMADSVLNELDKMNKTKKKSIRVGYIAD